MFPVEHVYVNEGGQAFVGSVKPFLKCDHISAEMREITAKKQTVLELRDQLVEMLIPSAKSELNTVQSNLSGVFIAALGELCKAVKSQMTGFLNQAMGV